MSGKYATAWSVLAAISMGAKEAVAQGCVSCYTTAAAGGTQTIHALRNGIVVLLVPPALMFVAVVVVVLRWRTSAESDPQMQNQNGPMDAAFHAAWQQAEIASPSEE
jgi:hypothetical protein